MFSQDQEVIEAMSKFVVVSLYTDNGPRHLEFDRWRTKMTGGATTPVYAFIDPAESGDIKLGQVDYNGAIDGSFARKIERAHRRFLRNQRKRGRATK